MNPYQFTSEIYRLLGELDGDLVRELRAMPLSSDVGSIVSAFCAAARVGSSKQELLNLPLSISPDPVQEFRGVVPDDGPHITGFLQSIIAGRKGGVTNAQLVEMLDRAGVQVGYRTKEGRHELLRRVERQLSELPLSKRDRVLSAFQRLAQTGETEGWMKVIRNRGEP